MIRRGSMNLLIQAMSTIKSITSSLHQNENHLIKHKCSKVLKCMTRKMIKKLYYLVIPSLPLLEE